METNDKKNQTQEKLRVTCKSCGKSFNIRIPSKPGRYSVKCPHCAQSISLTFSEKESQLKKLRRMAKKVSAPQINAPVLGKTVEVKDRVYVIKTLAVVNHPYKAICPICGSNIPLLPTVVGKPIKASCKKCHSLVYYKAVEKAPSNGVSASEKAAKEEDAKTDKDEPVKKNKTIKIAVPKGAIAWKRGKGILAKTRVFRLREGANTIGRKDDTSPSDIMIERDDEISRRSIMIDVVYNDEKKDFTYELKVLRNTNPVYVNGRPMGNDEVISLNYNDIICLGKTNITFIQIKNKK